VDNERIRQEISRRYPPSQFPFHIRVIGGKAVAKVIDFYIWDDRRIELHERVSVFPGRGESAEVLTIVKAKLAGLVAKLDHRPSSHGEKRK
jgi:hypothetical protein